MKSKKITLINDLNNLNYNSNYIFSAFNLAFISYYLSGKINPKGNFYLWCDGIIGKFYSKSQKIPGNQFIKLFFKYKFSEITVMGNYTRKQHVFLQKKFKTKIKFVVLPIINKKNIKNYVIKIKKNSLILITIPTPKQEMLAVEILKKNKNYKIICIGGGLSIASGEVKVCPNLIKNIGLEFIWRLNTDPLRRIKRLLYTFFVYIFNISIIKKKIKIKIV